MKQCPFFIGFCLSPIFLFAQKEASICPFGAYNILDMNTQPPTLTVGGNAFTWGNVGAISSETGQLLFYSDGNTVWYGDHTPLPNGQLNPVGSSYMRDNLFVPVGIGRKRYYYLFTLNHPDDDYNSQCRNPSFVQTDTSLTYSVIDMSLNAGKGDVSPSMRNIPLLQPALGLNAVFHANGLDTWVVAQNFVTREIYAFLVGGCGVSAPVVSAPPPASHPTTPRENTGFLYKLSPNGRNGLYFNVWDIDQYQDTVLAGELGFNDSTGGFSNPTVFDRFHFGNGLVRMDICASVAYTADSRTIVAPDIKKTFVIDRGDSGYTYTLVPTDSIFINQAYTYTFPGDNNIMGLNTGEFSRLYRYGLLDSTDITISSQATNKEVFNCAYWGNLSPMYLYANQMCLFNQSYSDPAYHSPTVRCPVMDSTFRTCQLSPLTVAFRQASNAKRLLWDFGDGSPKVGSNSLSDTIQVHTYAHPGRYMVTAVASYGCLSDTSKSIVTVDSLPVILLSHDSLVDICSPLTLDAGAGFSGYLWQDGDTSRTYTVSGPGKYSVTVTNSCGNATGSLSIKKAYVVAPNVFTPNNDGANEYFWLPNIDVLDRQLSVLNRDGEQVYSSQHYNNEWKANGLPDGIYYYYFTRPGCETVKGYVQVVR